MDMSENVKLLMEISGLDCIMAERILVINENNLEQAINFHLEEGSLSDPTNIAGPSTSAASHHMQSMPLPNMPDLTTNAETSIDIDDDGVRAPIPPKRETMLLPEEDNFRYRKRRIVPQRVCSLRNFAHEGSIQEHQIGEHATPHHHRQHPAVDDGGNSAMSDGPSSSGSSFSGFTPVNDDLPSKKRSRLVDLFRPPLDLSFTGSLQSVRECGRAQNRWIIVNLQNNAEFASQLLNRDLWSNRQLRAVIQKFFLFWQVSIDNPEGLRFQVFYGAKVLPYICIIDPRTGEEKLSYKNGFKFSADEFVQELKDFLRINNLHPEIDDSDKVPAIDFSNLDQTTEPTLKKSATLTEAEEMLLAIQNSLRESQINAGDSDGRIGIPPAALSIEDVIQIDSDTDSEPEEIPLDGIYEQYLGSSTDDQTKIILRLPNGSKDTIQWPHSTKIKALKLYVETQYPDLTKDPYKIMCPFPRQNLLELDMAMDLKAANLHPTAILHLYQDD